MACNDKADPAAMVAIRSETRSGLDGGKGSLSIDVLGKNAFMASVVIRGYLGQQAPPAGGSDVHHRSSSWLNCDPLLGADCGIGLPASGKFECSFIFRIADKTDNTTAHSDTPQKKTEKYPSPPRRNNAWAIVAAMPPTRNTTNSAPQSVKSLSLNDRIFMARFSLYLSRANCALKQFAIALASFRFKCIVEPVIGRPVTSVTHPWKTTSVLPDWPLHATTRSRVTRGPSDVGAVVWFRSTTS